MFSSLCLPGIVYNGDGSNDMCLEQSRDPHSMRKLMCKCVSHSCVLSYPGYSINPAYLHCGLKWEYNGVTSVCTYYLTIMSLGKKVGGVLHLFSLS